jgi:protein O-mannosyl-transferase
MAATSPLQRAWQRHTIASSLALILLCIAFAWGGVLWGSFQYDDHANILTDPVMHDSGLLLKRLQTGLRPLTRVSYVVDQWLWGAQAGGWLLTNLVLHTATTLGLWWLMHRGSAPALAALAGALVFALQPAHGMTVAYVSGRSGSLMCALLVAAMLLSQSYLQSGQRKHLAGALLCFALGVAAKETALIFPVLMALWIATQAPTTTGHWKAPPRTLLLSLAVMAIICLGLAAYSPRYQSLLAYSLGVRSPWDSLAHNAAALPATASLLLRPWALAVEHVAPLGGLPSALGASGLVLWLAIAARCWRAQPWITLGMLWPLVALLPSHSLVAKLDAVNESNLYLAWLGPALAVAAGVRPVLGYAVESSAMKIVLLLTITAAALSCGWRTRVWGDSVWLWQEATLSAPSARTWNNLGMAHLNHDQPALARHAFTTALQYQPLYAPASLNLEMLDLLSKPWE